MRFNDKTVVCIKYVVIVTFLSCFLMSCAKGPSGEKGAIMINDYELTTEEFDMLFAESGIDENTPKAREAFLENLVTRKLLLQEAQRQGLDKKEDFLHSVEHFWEQSLLKIVIDTKVKQISRGLTVSDREIRDYYNVWVQKNPNNPKTISELREPIKKQLLQKKQTQKLDSWIEGLKNNANVKVDKKALGIE